MSVEFQYNVTKQGYYPQGGGQAELSVSPIKDFISPINLTKRSPINKIFIEYLLTREDVKTKDATKSMMKDVRVVVKSLHPEVDADKIEVEVETRLVTSKKFKECYGIILHGYGDSTFIDASYYADDETLGVDEISEKCSQLFADNLKAGGCVDIHHQDQLLIYMALAKGKSQILVGNVLSEHTQGVFYILRKFIPNISINVIPQLEEKKVTANIIEIEGIGLAKK